MADDQQTQDQPVEETAKSETDKASGALQSDEPKEEPKKEVKPV